MKNPEEVQNSYAEALGYDSFQLLIETDINALDWHTSNVQKLYAVEAVSTYYQEILSKLI